MSDNEGQLEYMDDSTIVNSDEPELQLDELPNGYPCWHVRVGPSGRVEIENGFEKVKRIFYTVITVLFIVIISTFDLVLWTRISKSLAKVAFVISEVIYPFTFTLVIALFAVAKEMLGACCYKRCGKQKHYGKKSVFSNGCRKLLSTHYFKLFIVMAICDATGSLLAMYPIIQLDPRLVLLLVQLNLPIVQIMAKIYLDKGYKSNHYIGSAVVFTAVIILLTASYSNGESNTRFLVSTIFWSLLLIISRIPIAFGTVYKERYLKDDNMDVIWTNVWVSVIQTLFSIPLSAVVLIPTPEEPILVTSPNSSVQIDSFFQYISFGIQCLSFDLRQANSTSSFLTSGVNSAFNSSFDSWNLENSIGSLNVSGTNFVDVDTAMQNSIDIHGIISTSGVICKGTGFLYIIYIILNVLYNISITQLLKLTTSGVTSIVHIFVLVTSHFAFGIKSIAGLTSKDVNVWNYLSLGCSIGGMLIYWLKPETQPVKRINPLSSSNTNNPIGCTTELCSELTSVCYSRCSLKLRRCFARIRYNLPGGCLRKSDVDSTVELTAM